MKPRIHIASLLGLGLMLSLAALSACSESGQETKLGVSIEPAEYDNFRVQLTSAGTCAEEHEPGADKLTPEESELRDILGEGTESFVILMREELSLEDYPLPAPPHDREASKWSSDLDYVARAEAIAESQACAIASINPSSGAYEHSFLLINAFVAELDVSEAIRMSERADIKSVELSQTGAPPHATRCCDSPAYR